MQEPTCFEPIAVPLLTSTQPGSARLPLTARSGGARCSSTLLDHDDVQYSVDISRIYLQHLEHVNPVYVGFIAHISYPEPDGTILHGHVLIDGHHRAARCLRDEIPFGAHVLSEDGSRQVLLELNCLARDNPHSRSQLPDYMPPSPSHSGTEVFAR